VALSVVSRSFHELAAAQLYRVFNVTLANTSLTQRMLTPVSPRSSTSILTGGLDTLASSGFNYPRFLKQFSVGFRGFGDKSRPCLLGLQNTAYGGKFINTLLYLVLRSAESLESFRYGVPTAQALLYPIR
jgi:hypothetical protein